MASFRNCTAMHTVYPNGVGRYGARDHTSGTPVTNFRRKHQALSPEPRTRSRQGRHRLREAV